MHFEKKLQDRIWLKINVLDTFIYNKKNYLLSFLSQWDALNSEGILSYIDKLFL